MITTPLTAELVRGAAELEQTGRGVLPHRLPARARAQCPDPQLAMVESQPAGVRLALRTAATRLEVDAVATKRVYVGAPPRPDGVHELVVDGEVHARASLPAGDRITIDMMSGSTTVERGEPATLVFAGLPEREKDVELWLPHDETTELVALRSDAPVAPLARSRRTWLHHGSSVSQGSNAASPLATWPAVAARAAGVDLVNLGLGGSALLDPFTARTLRDTPADVVSVKLGLNVVNQDLMRLRAFTASVHGFLDTIREGHPTTPLVVVSPILCPIHEEVPGPTGFDPAGLVTGELRFAATGDPAAVANGALTLAVVRAELARIVAQRAVTDPALTYLDGRELYGEADAERFPLPDRLHPDTATHRLIGERFAALALSP